MTADYTHPVAGCYTQTDSNGIAELESQAHVQLRTLLRLGRRYQDLIEDPRTLPDDRKAATQLLVEVEGFARDVAAQWRIPLLT